MERKKPLCPLPSHLHVRIEPELYADLRRALILERMSVREWVDQAVRDYVLRRP